MENVPLLLSIQRMAVETVFNTLAQPAAAAVPPPLAPATPAAVARHPLLPWLSLW